MFGMGTGVAPLLWAAGIFLLHMSTEIMGGNALAIPRLQSEADLAE